MVSQHTTESDLEETNPLPQDNLGSGYFGSSMYGGRPTFALTRRDGPNGACLTLYELLPEEQATARSDRLKRGGPSRGLVIESFDEVFDGPVDSDTDKQSSLSPRSQAHEDADRWSWDDWAAVKVSRLSESHLRAILPLVRETLDGADLDDVPATSAGRADVFLPETVGVRLALGFLGVKPIQRVDRMRAFCRGIARMSDEECYYWHAKCRSPSSPSGEKALRTMLTTHI